MGAKKKVEVQQPPPQPPPPEKTVNTVVRVITSDEKEFKITEELLVRYSPKARLLCENAKDTTIHLQDIDGQSFDIVMHYLQLHKEKQPAKIAVPIKTNQSLKYIMEQSDAELIQNVMQMGDMTVSKIMDAALILEIESLRKRMACGVALKLMRNTVEELQELYNIKNYNFEEESLRSSVRPLIQDLKKYNMEQQS